MTDADDDGRYRCRICTVVREKVVPHDSQMTCIACVKQIVKGRVSLGQEISAEHCRMLDIKRPPRFR